MATTYLTTLEHLLAFVLPALTGAYATRRLILSRSFNRLIYALMAALSALTIAGLLRVGGAMAMPHDLAHIFAYMLPALWLLVTDLTPSLRGSYALPPGV